MLLFYAGVAFGQSVPNGDFDDGLKEWSGTGQHRIGLTNASPGYAVLAGDTKGEPGWMQSSPFVVTQRLLEWDARGFKYDVQLIAGADEVLVDDEDEPPRILWWGRFLDISDACGATVSLYLECAEPEERADVDAFVLAGDLCIEFEDRDFDGGCPRGTDLNGDGDCADDHEPSVDVVDCADDDDDIGPHATEQVASGVDENCDGLEACFVDKDGDGVGSSEVVHGPDLQCEGKGLAKVSGDRCEGFDDRLDHDGDGIPDGCDEADEPPPVPEPEPTMGRFRGGTGCATGGARPFSWVWVLLGWLGVRRAASTSAPWPRACRTSGLR